MPNSALPQNSPTKIAKLKNRVRTLWVCALAKVLKHRAVITVISEALAAAAILAAGLSFTYDSWQGRKVSISGAVITSTPSHIALLVTNGGGVDVVIKRVNLLSGTDIKNHVEIEQDGLLLEKGKSKILSSNRSQLNTTVQYKKPDDSGSFKVPGAQTPCHANIEYVVAGEEDGASTIDFVCYAATMFGEEELEFMRKQAKPTVQ
jgi:hypothetical protein